MNREEAIREAIKYWQDDEGDWDDCPLCQHTEDLWDELTDEEHRRFGWNFCVVCPYYEMYGRKCSTTAVFDLEYDDPERARRIISVLEEML